MSEVTPPPPADAAGAPLPDSGAVLPPTDPAPPDGAQPVGTPQPTDAPTPTPAPSEGDDTIGDRIDSKIEIVKQELNTKLDDISAKIDQLQAGVDAWQGRA